MIRLIVFSCVLLLLGPPPAYAEVWRVSPSFREYFEALRPGATSSRLNFPLLLVMPDASRLDRAILPFVGAEETQDVIDSTLLILGGELQPTPAQSEHPHERYPSVVQMLVGDASPRYPLVVLIHAEPFPPELGPELPEGHARFERALVNWAEEEPDGRHLLVIALTLP